MSITYETLEDGRVVELHPMSEAPRDGTLFILRLPDSSGFGKYKVACKDVRWPESNTFFWFEDFSCTMGDYPFNTPVRMGFGSNDLEEYRFCLFEDQYKISFVG